MARALEPLTASIRQIKAYLCDTYETQTTYAQLNGGKADERVLKVFMENSGETVDWLMEETDGIAPVIKLLGDPPFAHMWEDQQVAMLEVITNKAIDGGSNIHYSTEGVHLIKESDQIIGIIGKRTKVTIKATLSSWQIEVFCLQQATTTMTPIW